MTRRSQTTNRRWSSRNSRKPHRNVASRRKRENHENLLHLEYLSVKQYSETEPDVNVRLDQTKNTASLNSMRSKFSNVMQNFSRKLKSLVRR